MRPWLPALALLMAVPVAELRTHVAQAAPLVRCGALTLYLKPGINPPPSCPPSPLNPIAPDAPRGTFPVFLPLYPGLTPQPLSLGTPYASVPSDPYLQTAAAEYHSTGGPDAVRSWYRAVMPACGWRHRGYWYTNASIFTTGHDYVSRANPELSVQVSVGSDLHGGSYLALAVEAIILPPRPASSYLHGPFVQLRMAIKRGTPHSGQPLWSVSHTAVTDRAAIARLVTAVNSIRGRRTALPFCLGGLSLVGPIWLSFVRSDGSTVHAYEMGAGACGGLAVNGVRWLTDPGDVWNQIVRLGGGRG